MVPKWLQLATYAVNDFLNLLNFEFSLFNYDFIDYYYIDDKKKNAGYNLYIFYVGYANLQYKDGLISIE